MRVERSKNLQRHNPHVLFALLLLLLLLSPVLERSMAGRVVMDIVFCGVLIAAVAAIEVRRSAVLIVAVIASSVLALRWADALPFTPEFAATGYVLYLLLIIAAFVNLMRVIVCSEAVTLGVILDAISAYLLIGVIWAVIFLLIHSFDPSAFDFDVEERYEAWTKYLYLSFMTLTTLGYGDVTSPSPFVQIWAVVESIVGVFFQAVIVARLVSLYVPRS